MVCRRSASSSRVPQPNTHTVATANTSQWRATRLDSVRRVFYTLITRATTRSWWDTASIPSSSIALPCHQFTTQRSKARKHRVISPWASHGRAFCRPSFNHSRKRCRALLRGNSDTNSIKIAVKQALLASAVPYPQSANPGAWVGRRSVKCYGT